MKEFVIYDNYNLGSKKNYQEALENILDNVFNGKDSVTLIDDYGIEVEVTREQYGKTIKEETIWNEINMMNSLWLDDVIYTLAHCDNGNGIIAIADIGTWNGRIQEYKLYDNLKYIIYSNDDYTKLYLNSNYDLIKETSHHDGSNKILYRYWKENLTDTQRKNFLDKLYRGKVTKKDISRYTSKAGLEIASYFGY